MAQPLRSIGQVLAVLKPDFEDISISKIRFLETEGLISPERAPSGYRRYAIADIERLRYVLSAQKNHYLPLKVIREHLALIDEGHQPPELETPKPQPPAETEAAQGEPVKRPLRLSRSELKEASGLPEATLVELERQLVIRPRRGTAFYGRDALTLAVVARKLGLFGMDARHLRAIKYSAEREVGLIEAAVAPYSRRQASSRATTVEIMQLVMHAHAALMQSALDK